jgi:intracellular proteinase inhibitor BsuPI
MKTRLVPALLLAAVFAYACGPRNHAAEPSRAPLRRTAVSGPAVASSLQVKLNHDVAFAFHVTNGESKRLELTFPSGQTHEIVVLDSAGKEVWRWSEGRMFTQALQSKVLEANETVTYDASWKPASGPGKYVAVASLMSQNHPLQERIEFEIP